MTITKSGFSGTTPSSLSTSWRCVKEDDTSLKKKHKKTQRELLSRLHVFVGSRVSNSLLVGISTAAVGVPEEPTLKRGKVFFENTSPYLFGEG